MENRIIKTFYELNVPLHFYRIEVCDLDHTWTPWVELWYSKNGHILHRFFWHFLLTWTVETTKTGSRPLGGGGVEKLQRLQCQLGGQLLYYWTAPVLWREILGVTFDNLLISGSLPKTSCYRKMPGKPYQGHVVRCLTWGVWSRGPPCWLWSKERAAVGGPV